MEQTKNEVSIKAISKPEDKFSVYNFAEVDLPQAVEKSYEDWVTYGEDNLFPVDVIVAWLQSSIHNALTNGIVQMIAGAGLNFSQVIPEVEKFRTKINRHGDTLDDLINKTSFDLYLHGYYGWQVVWNQARTAIVEIYHTPAEQIRSGKANDDGQIEDYYVSWDWTQFRKKKFEPTRIPALNLLDRSAGRQMIFVKQYRPMQFYYSTPSYIGGLNWILMDNRVGEFHLNNIANGFFPSSVVQFYNGEPPQEEKRKIERGFMDKFTGKGQSKIVFVYNNNRDEQVDFQTYEPANIDKRFRDLMPEIAKNIMIAHRVPSPLLFGIREGGGLGNNAEELESSSLLMNKMVIVPFQQIIINELLTIFKINGWDTEISIETLQPGQFLEGDTGDAEADTGDAKPGEAVKPGQPVKPGAKKPVAADAGDIQKQALNGAQISSLLEVIGNVTSGLLTKESAKAIISASFPTFTPEQIAEVVDNINVTAGTPVDPGLMASFSHQGSQIIGKEHIAGVIAYLKGKGEKRADLEAEGWVLVQEDEKLTKEGIKLKLKPVPEEFQVSTSKLDSEPEEPSVLDTGLYKIRYEYRGPFDKKNRDFCHAVLDLNYIYRFEDINEMSIEGANPEFGEYSIWDFKGSYGCRHRWHRLVFFRKRNSKGQFLPAEGLENDKLVGPAATPAAVIPDDEQATTVNPKPA